MTERKFGLGTFVCIYNRDFSKILLLKRNKKEKPWGNVGGMVDIGEKIIDACVREAREEIGVNLNPEKLKLIEIKETPYFSDLVHGIHFVYVTTLDENKKIQISEESDEYYWFDLDNLPEKTLDSKEYLCSIANKAKNQEVFL